MKWKNSYSVTIPLIDAQHKQLFRMSDQLDADLKEGLRAKEIEKTLIQMGEYATKHFQIEEKCMEDVNYPGLQQQKEIHKQFRESFQAMYEDFQKNGLSQEIVDSLRRDLTNWIRDHVLGIDQQFGEFCKNRKESQG